MKKIVKLLLLVIFVLILISATGICLLWHDEIATLSSLKVLRHRNDSRLEGDVYEIHVKGSYYFDKFLEQGGVKNDKELISFLTSNITKGLLKMDIKESSISCSAFTAKTKEGKRLFGRNYDLSKTNSCIVYTAPEDGRYATITSVDLKFLGIDTDKGIRNFKDKLALLSATYAPLDGINSAGLSCGIFMSYQGEDKKVVATNQNTDNLDITSTTMLRLILDYAANIEEAVALVSQLDLHDSANTSYHYMIADASGRSAILEWVNGTDHTDTDGSKRKLIVTYNDLDDNIGEREAAADYQWITNFIIQPDYYEKLDERSGYDRYERLYQDLSNISGVVEDEKEAMSILANVGRRSWNNKDANTCTVHSVVYNLSDKTALWVSNENFDDKSAYFNLSFKK